MNKKLNLLIAYNVLLTIALIAYVLYTNTLNNQNQNIVEELTVERINIVEKDGTPKIIITNKERQPTDLVIEGKSYDYGRGKAGGILMYNDLGEEMGGYLFSGDEKEHGFNVSFDQFKNDQILALRSSEILRDGNKQKLYGLALWERPDSITTKQILEEEERIEKIISEQERQNEYEKLEKQGYYGANTFFAGRLWNGSTGLFLRDKTGNGKIRLFIDEEGNPRLELFDKNGEPTSIEKISNEE